MVVEIKCLDLYLGMVQSLSSWINPRQWCFRPWCFILYTLVLFVDLILSIDMKLSDVLNHFFDLKLLSLLVHSIRLVLSIIMVHSLLKVLSLRLIHLQQLVLSLLMIRYQTMELFPSMALSSPSVLLCSTDHSRYPVLSSNMVHFHSSGTTQSYGSFSRPRLCHILWFTQRRWNYW